ncbi:MAG: glycosyltransferase family 39 protein [Patescibacteria group bacterium]
MNFKQRWAILAGILLVGAFLRLSQLSQFPPGLFPDEAMNGNNVHEALGTGNFKLFYPENNGREGLFINLQAISVSIFGHTFFALRLMSALFGILTIAAVYLFIRAYTRDTRIALIGGALMATSFWHLMFSRIGFRAIMAPFFLTIGLGLLYEVWAKRNSKRHDLVLAASALGGLLFGLGFHSYIAYRAAVLLLIPPLWLFIKSAREERSHCILCVPALFLLFTFVAGAPLGWYFLERPQDFFGRTSQISVFSSENPLFGFIKNTGITIQMLYFAGDFNWRHNFAGAPSLWWPVAIAFTAGIWESWRKKYWALFLWFLVMLLPVAISSEGLPHALRAIIMIPPVIIFAAIGFDALWRWTARTIHPDYARLVAILILLLGGIRTYNMYFREWAPRPEVRAAFGGNLYDIGVFLKNSRDDIPKYVITDEVDTIDRTGRPMTLQPILFASETYLPEPPGARNIFYYTLRDIEKIDCTRDCMIIPIGNEERVLEAARARFPTLRATRYGSVLVAEPARPQFE